MAEITRITQNKITELAADTGFQFDLMEKDYYITVLLYLLKDLKNVYFKGGTALQKILLNYARLSEDIDFTVTHDVEQIRDEIIEIVKSHDFFSSVTLDKKVDRFTRILVHFQSLRGDKKVIFIDLNQKASLHLPPEQKGISHFYQDYIPTFSFSCLAEKELIAEKVRAAIERNKPRDHFDLYQIITRQLPIDLALVEAKCKESEGEFDVIQMFHRANKLKARWDKDVAPLLAKEVSFSEVMKTLAKHFNLKEEKAKKKKIMEEISNSDGYKKLLKNISSLIEKLPPEVRSEMRKY